MARYFNYKFQIDFCSMMFLSGCLLGSPSRRVISLVGQWETGAAEKSEPGLIKRCKNDNAVPEGPLQSQWRISCRDDTAVSVNGYPQTWYSLYLFSSTDTLAESRVILCDKTSAVMIFTQNHKTTRPNAFKTLPPPAKTSIRNFQTTFFNTHIRSEKCTSTKR